MGGLGEGGGGGARGDVPSAPLRMLQGSPLLRRVRLGEYLDR